MRRLVGGAVLCSCLLAVLPPASASATTPQLTEFSIAAWDTDPLGIAPVSDGTVVFAEGSTSDFGIGTSSDVTVQVPGLSGPAADVVVADGDEWLTEPGAGKIARVANFTTPFQTVTQFSLPGNAQPEGIAAGPDGNVWFTDSANPAAIGRITPAGAVTLYPGLPANSQPTGITAGPDGNLWFTETGNPGAIGRITPTGTISQYPIGIPANSDPESITAGPDGNLWFTEAANPGAIARITPSGTITQYPTGLTANSQPTGITAGPGGDVWFTEAANPGAIGWISPQGLISQTPTPTVNSVPAEIAEAPDDQLWFTEDGAHGKLGQVTLPPPVTITDPAFAVGQTSAILAGAVTPGGFAATYHFEWGTTSSYGQSLPGTDADAGSGSTQNAVTQTLTGLTPATTYHYRVVATNCGGCQAGTADGSDMTFTTASATTTTTPPPATTTTASTPPATTTAPASSTTTTTPAPPQPVAAAALGQSAVAAVTSGTVLIKEPGWGQMQPLSADQNIPIGSVIDARTGHLDVTTEITRAGRMQSAAVWGGEFVLGQAGPRGLTTFHLVDTGLRCAARHDAHTTNASAVRADATPAGKRKKKKKASLWASDSHGRYSTRGNNSVATVRGTEWETVESCRGTLTRVKRGVVSVRDLHTQRSVLVHAGHSFLARR